MSKKIKNNNEKFKFNFLILVIILLIVITIDIILVLKVVLFPKLQKEQKNIKQEILETKKDNEEIGKKTMTSEEVVLEKLKNGTERDRMEYYVGRFITYIEERRYNEAYELLYPEFKETYFKTLEEFKKYIENQFPEVIIVEYINIIRYGDIYIIETSINNGLSNSDKSKSFKQRFVIREDDYNKYVLSFQVI